MNKTNFLDSENVKSFLAWLACNFTTIEVRLNIKKSRFVPVLIQVQLTGVETVLQYYQWKSVGMVKSDWSEAKVKLNELGAALKMAKNDDQALSACKAILEWGGNRNWNVGAYPLLRDLAEENQLCQYLKESKKALALNKVGDYDFGCIKKMNSMLTKVHALHSNDCLPIYDSRVAAAIATLVEMWRISNNRETEPIPVEMSFPALDKKRTVGCAFPNAKEPEMLRYNKLNSNEWVSAKVRLGLLMQAFLEENKTVFEHEKNRMHAFEACLFMLGYNPKCLTSL